MNYALLVGINKYHPDSEISDLDGCANDVIRTKAYLEKRFAKNISIKVLLDDGKLYGDGPATRTEIIHQFRHHLRKAKEGEFAIFQFSGHGSTEFAPKEIIDYQGSHLNETLVCHDSRVNGIYDLADIELKVLISEVALQGAEVVVILDACFSGSANRFGSKKIKKFRTTSASIKIRPIETYLVGAQQPIPDPRHILLAACKKDELAAEYIWETPKAIKFHGLFTHSLLSVLEDLNDPIPYNLLMTKCSNIVNEALQENPFASQTPVLDSSAHFYAFNHFLNTNNHFDGYHQFALRYIKKLWVADFSLINCWPIDPDQRIRFAVFQDSKLTKPIVEIETKNIFLGYCSFDPVPALEELNKANNYVIVPIEYPVPPLNILLNDLKNEYLSDFQNLKKIERNLINGLISIAGSNKSANSIYELIINESQYDILYSEIQESVLPEKLTRYSHNDPKRQQKTNIKQLSILLEHICRWEQYYRINLDLQQSYFNKYVDELFFQFVLIPENDASIIFSKVPDRSTTQITIDYPGEWVHSDYGIIEYGLKSRNPYNDRLFFYLIHLSHDFKIETYFHEEVQESPRTINLLKEKRFGLGLPSGINQSTDTFKLIISKEELPNLFPDQPSIGKLFQEVKDKKHHRAGGQLDHICSKNPFDWFTHTFSVKVLRQLGEISKKDLTLAYGQIIIMGHPVLRAKVSLTSSARKMRSPYTDYIMDDYARNNNLEILDFSEQGKKETILEIHHIEHEQSLSIRPLEIIISPKNLNENETLLACTFSNEYFKDNTIKFLINVGKTQKLANGNVSVLIENIYLNMWDGRLFGGKSTKICFFKIKKRISIIKNF